MGRASDVVGLVVLLDLVLMNFQESLDGRVEQDEALFTDEAESATYSACCASLVR